MIYGFITAVNLLNRELIKRIFSTQEGMIFIFSIILILSTAVFLFVYYFFDPSFSSKVATMILTNIFVGRVPALSLGYAANLSHLCVIAFNILAEMILVTLIYSLFVFSFQGVVKLKSLDNFFKKIKDKKDLHKKSFQKYGSFGLFIFVFIPFWMTGPVVGSIIGFLIGLKHYTVIFTVFLAMIISITLWGLFLQEIVNFIGQFDIRFSWLLIISTIIAVIVLRYRRRG